MSYLGDNLSNFPLVQVRWNLNGNWVLTSSWDHTVKVYDVRTLREMVTWKGHNREVNCAAWHPVQEGERHG